MGWDCLDEILVFPLSFLMSQYPEEAEYHILRQLEERPRSSQRKLASELGCSVGKINYCIKGLIAKGCIKAVFFKNTPTKNNYMYTLTSKGVEEKIRLTSRFLRNKIAEYDALQHEIEELLRAIGKEEEFRQG